MRFHGASMVDVEWEIISECDVFEIQGDNTNYHNYQPG